MTTAVETSTPGDGALRDMRLTQIVELYLGNYVTLTKAKELANSYAPEVAHLVVWPR